MRNYLCYIDTSLRQQSIESMTTRTVKFAVLGYGNIGKRHVEMINRNPDAVLSCIIDIKNVEPGEVGLDNVQIFNSLDAFLSDNLDVDVVCIATPNGLHAQQAISCLKHNYHVVIEKPLALLPKDAEEIVEVAKEVDRNVFCVMQNRYSPPSKWIKEVIDNKVLGNIYMVQLNCFWNRDERYYVPGSWHGSNALDGGTIFTQFSHFVDILFWLFGDISNIQGCLRDFNHHHLTEFEDSGIIQFDLENGGIGSLNFSTSVWDKNLESSLLIIGEKGSVKIGGQYMNKVEYCHIKDYQLPELPETNPGNNYGAYFGSAQNHNYVIQNVVDVLNNRAAIKTTASEGLVVVDMINRMYQLRSVSDRSE